MSRHLRSAVVAVVAVSCALTTPGRAATAVQEPAARPPAAPDSAPVADPTLNISGFVQIYFKARHDANGDGAVEPSVFRAQRVRLQARGRVNRRVRYEVEIDPRAPTIGGVLRDAFVTLSYLPRHDIVVGQMKTPFGYENSTSSSRLFTVNRSELAESIARGITLRDIGAGVTGSVELAPGWRIEDEILLVNGSGLNVQADDTPRKNLWGRIGLRYRNEGLTLRWGASFANGDQFEPLDPAAPTDPAYTFTFNRLGTDVQVDHGRFLFVGEYATSDETAPAAVDATGKTSAYSVMAVGKTSRGVGPVIRYDAFEDYKRMTYGAYAGLPTSPLSFMLSYESWEDGAGPHDGRMYARLQVRF